MGQTDRQTAGHRCPNEQPWPLCPGPAPAMENESMHFLVSSLNPSQPFEDLSRSAFLSLRFAKPEG